MSSFKILPVTLNWTLSEKWNAIPNPNPNPKIEKNHYLRSKNLHIGK